VEDQDPDVMQKEAKSGMKLRRRSSEKPERVGETLFLEVT
jgi:hypothetical protein